MNVEIPNLVWIILIVALAIVAGYAIGHNEGYKVGAENGYRRGAKSVSK